MKSNASSVCPHYKNNLLQQYLAYTYPYDIFGRIEDIQQAVKATKTGRPDSLYPDFLLSAGSGPPDPKASFVPILTLEGDKPRPIDNRTKFRIEAFIDVLRK